MPIASRRIASLKAAHLWQSLQAHNVLPRFGTCKPPAWQGSLSGSVLLKCSMPASAAKPKTLAEPVATPPTWAHYHQRMISMVIDTSVAGVALQPSRTLSFLGHELRCSGTTGQPPQARLHTISTELKHTLKVRNEYQKVHVRTMAKRAKAKKQKAKVQDPEFLPGEEYQVFSHETPTTFRLLSATGATQLVVWTGVTVNSLLGMSFLPVIPTWMILLGSPMSIGLFLMVQWHATHHVAGISVIPGIADQILLTTHTMTGGLKTRKLLRYQMDVSDAASRPGKYRQIYVRGETWNYVMDTDGKVIDQRLFDLLLDNKPIPKE